MTIARIMSKLDERPFRPFDIQTADGTTVTVRSPDFAWIHPKGRTMYVCPDPDLDADQVIDLGHVTKLTYGQQQSNGRRRPRK